MGILRELGHDGLRGHLARGVERLGEHLQAVARIPACGRRSSVRQRGTANSAQDKL